MRTKSIAFIILLLINTGLMFAQSPIHSDDDYRITVIRSDLNGFVIKFELFNYDIVKNSAGSENHDKILFAGVNHSFEENSELPSLSRVFLLPGNLSANCEIRNVENEVVDDIRLNPGFHPNETITVSRPAISRSIRFAALDIFPFTYDEDNLRLEVVRSFEAEIYLSPGSSDNPQTSRSLAPQGFSSGVVNSSINPEIAGLDDLDNQPGEYLIILPDQSFETFIQPFSDWKTQTGYIVTTSYFDQIGATAGDLYDYLLEAYQSWEYPPEYVLLIGDVDGDIAIPTFYYAASPIDSAVADHQYTLLEGDDYFSDIELGRISVQTTAELENIVNKILIYESQPELNGYLERAFMIADTSAKNSLWVKRWAANLIYQTVYSDIDSIFFFDSYSPYYMSNTFNQGHGIVNFRGWHTWGGFTQDDIHNLNTNEMMGVLFGCAGATNALTQEESIGEAFLRTGDLTDPDGMIAVIGPSDPNTFSKYDGTVDQGLMWGLFGEDIYSLSPLLNRAKMELWLSFPWNRGTGYTYNSVECYFNIYNLLGDPSLNIWRTEPNLMEAALPDSIPFGQNYLNFTANTLSGAPLAGGFCQVMHEGIQMASGISNDAGEFSLVLPQAQEGMLDITITDPNHVHLSGQVVIVNTPAYLGCVDFEIVDDNSGWSSGNGDGIINPGETVELYLTLLNYGTEPVNNTTGTISISASNAEVIVNQQPFGNVAPWSQAVNLQPFVIEIRETAFDGETIVVDIQTNGTGGMQFESQCNLEISAPLAEISNISFPSAVNDTIIGPGEESDLILELTNTGQAGWESLTCTIIVGLEGVALADSVSVFPACEPGAIVDNLSDPMHISIFEELMPGRHCPLTLYWEYDNGTVDTTEMTMQIGIPGESDPVTANDGYGYYCFSEGDVSYGNAPDFEWKEIDPDFGGQGTLIPLNDAVPFQGDNELLVLPAGFNFRYYGEEVDWLTVCSNGWLAPGEAVTVDYQNKPIPAAGEPSGMIAAFWDDLMLIDDGAVYYYYNDVENIFIIEWSRVFNIAFEALEVFEVILYDADFYPTPTYDSPIAINYAAFNDVDNQNDFCTIGILNHDLDAGLQYLYSNIYTPGADTLESGDALLFTTDPGVRVEPPSISYAPGSFDITLAPDETDTNYFYISNTGEADLEYELSIDFWEQVDASGGPDEFGYIWVDSDEPNGGVYRWVDISQIGYEVILTHNDSTSADLPFGFDFSFYGHTFNSIIVSANGWCSFTSHSSAWNNSSLPNNNAPENLVAAWWDDLDPTADGEIYVWSNQADSVVVSFYNIEHYGSTNGDYTYQVILEANGKIAFQYDHMGGQLGSATIGIQNADKTVGLLMNHNSTYVHDELRIDILKPWLELETLSGEVNGGETDSVQFIVSTQDLPEGDYLTEIELLSNDPLQTLPLYLPVNLHVVPSLNWVENLLISLVEEGIMLNWDASVAAEVYMIYRNDQPYFIISEDILIGETPETTFIDSLSISPQDDAYFYKVIAE